MQTHRRSLFVIRNLALGGIASIALFQNCSGFKSLDYASQSSLSVVAPAAPPCRFNGEVVPPGQSVRAFLNGGGTCTSETRVCRDGVLSGSYAYAACTPATPGGTAPCAFNGQSVASGAQVTAYASASVAAGGTCAAETRVCTNGNLSGSYGYATCTPATPQPAACAFDGQRVADGGQVTAYASASVAYACVSETRRCTNGNLSGSYGFAACVVVPPAGTAPCLFNGRTIASGARVTAFVSAVADGACVSQSRTCTNGVLSGNYAYDSCQAAGPAACVFNGTVVPNGQSVVAFARGSVPSGYACAPQVRTCANGALTGAGEYAACVVNAKSPCLFNGQTVAHGQNVVAYGASTGSCAPQTRTCADGALSGAGDFGSCDPTQPAACLLNGRTIASGDVARTFAAPVTDVGGSCSVEARACTAGVLSGSATASSCLARARFISADYVRPTSREGLADARWDDDAPTMDARYAKFKSIGIGLRIYNYWWSGLEDGGVAPSTAPVNCPAGHTMVPADETERARWGYHHYRCVNQGDVNRFDRLFTHDAANGIQTALVVWSAPPSYRYPGCLGNAWAGGTLYEGCVPRDDVMDDFEDIITFLALRHNGRNGYGKISTIVVWNENASGLWFDYSPVVPNRGVLNAAQRDQWLSKYAAMMVRVHDAVQRTSGGVMVDASTDPVWDTPAVGPGDAAHLGESVLIDGLWERLGVKYSWSVAVHPYGDVDGAPSPGWYNFNTVQNVVTGHQNAQLEARGLPTGTFQYPQGFLFASEQGWPQSESIDRQAKNICWAQAATLNSPFILSQTHNYFQSMEPQEATGGTSGQGAFYGLLPNRSAIDLSDMGSFATGAAYIATGPSLWGQTSANYCCQAAQVGCLQPAGTQPVYRSLGPHHLYSLMFTEGPGAGFRPEQTAFNLYSAGGADLAAVYRCRTTTGDYPLSLDSECEGLTKESLLGFAHQSPAAGLIPIYRRYNPDNGDHLATTVATEGDPAYHTESILGYVPAF